MNTPSSVASRRARQKIYRENNREKIRVQQAGYRLANREKRLAQASDYYHKNRETVLSHLRTLREEAKRKLGGKCRNCGCDDLRVLEFNHANGDGAKERKAGMVETRFLRQIISEDRSDIDLKCRLCNALDYLERKYGKLPFSVSWNR